MRLLVFKPMIPYLKVFTITLIICNALLAAVYSFHSPILERNATEGIAFLEKKEGLYLKLFPNVSENRYKNGAFTLDTFTDRAMLRTMVPKNRSLSSWGAALYMNNYARYWHGYAAVLRPLMVLFNYTQLRLLNVFLITVFTLATACLLAKHIGIQAAISFILALFCVKIFIIPLSFAYCSMFYLFFISFFILLPLAKWKKEPLLESHFFQYSYLFLE